MRKFTSLLLLGFALGSFAQTPGGVSGSELWFKTAPLNSDLQGYYRWQDFSGYSVNGNTIHYNADESKTASRNFDNALGAIGHFSYRPKSRTYNREGATFNAPIKHTLILKSRKK